MCSGCVALQHYQEQNISEYATVAAAMAVISIRIFLFFLPRVSRFSSLFFAVSQNTRPHREPEHCRACSLAACLVLLIIKEIPGCQSSACPIKRLLIVARWRWCTRVAISCRFSHTWRWLHPVRQITVTRRESWILCRVIEIKVYSCGGLSGFERRIRRCLGNVGIGVKQRGIDKGQRLLLDNNFWGSADGFW